MKKNLYLILVAFTSILLASIFIFSKKAELPTKTPSFKERSGLAKTGEWLNTKKAMEGLLAAIEQHPNDYKSMLLLSQAYIQEGRETGNHGYYDKAALDVLETILKNEPNNFEALCSKATVLLSQHHFTEGLAIAQKALPLNNNSAFIYGILCDANLELGDYKNATIMADKMVSIRPDIRSYARISYLREIYGDVPGAIEAIKLAVSAGYPGLEQTEWTRCILAHLYENKGSLDSAEIQYRVALQERPNYAFAIAGLGHIAKVKGNYKEAISYYEQAKTLITEFSFSDELTDLYKLTNQIEKATTNAQEVITMLGPNVNVEGESGHGHYADKELAYAYLKINDVDNALRHALLEHERRPNNIDVSETLAWAYYKKGNFKDANTYIDVALKTGSKNPTLLCRAGLIKTKYNQVPLGKQLITQALSINPFLETELKTEANPFL